MRYLLTLWQRLDDANRRAAAMTPEQRAHEARFECW